MKRAAILCACAFAAGLGCRERPQQAGGGVAAPGPTPAVSAGATGATVNAPTAPTSPPEAAPVDGGVLRRRLLGEPTTLNAVLQSSLPEAQVLQYVQRNLFDFDEKLVLTPGLASGMEISADGREYVVTLRSEPVWEDGRPVTAEDAVFTIRRVVDPKVPAPVFKTLFDDLESVEALDARRFRARFRAPYAFRAMAFVLPILPAHRFAGKDFARAPDNRAPLANGPYRVVAWKSGQSRRARAQSEGLGRARPLRRDPPAHRSRQHDRVPSPDLRGARRGPDRRDAQGEGPGRSRPSRMLPPRRVLHARLELRGPQQQIPALLRCARAQGADDADRPGGRGADPVSRLGAGDLRAVGPRLAGLRSVDRSAARSTRRRRVPSLPKPAGGTPTETARSIARGGRSPSSSSCRRASRRAGRSARCSPRSSRAWG